MLRRTRRLLQGFACLVSFCGAIELTTTRSLAAAEFTQADAAAALKKAVDFFRSQIAVEDGYVYLVSADLKKREGEARVSPTQVWIQPPATPAVGLAYLEAYKLTGEKHLLYAARETAECLIRGQLRSGGWGEYVEFNPQERAKHFDYRVDPPGDPAKSKKRSYTTLDDDKTQSCLKFLMRLDAETKFSDDAVHEATLYALDALVAVQYPNGAWPQKFVGPPKADDFPILKAGYPATWSREFPKVNYVAHYTFNDGTIADVIDVMLEAHTLYGKVDYRKAAERAGDFILAAQMPEPQPAWAQQYDAAMHPVWARKFEPPSVSGGESQGIVRILLKLYSATGEKRFLKPIPAALAYLKRSQRPDGRMARFYELQTNKPLYFTKDYKLTYSDADMPTHYGFIVPGKLDELQSIYDRASTEAWTAPKRPGPKSGKLSASISKEAREVARALDDRGAWVTDGKLRDHGDDDTTRVIDSRVFIKNLLTLARCAAAK